MKISIAMCTCNGAAHLREQLESIASQTLAPYEVVISDDASTDSTLELAESFAQQAAFPVVILRNTARLGSTRNFEQALQACTGELIALCDQDDIWYSHKLATLARVMDDPTAGAVFSDGDLLRESGANEGTLWNSFGLGKQELEVFTKGDTVSSMLRGNKVTGMTLMLRRHLLPTILPIPSVWIHDYWMAWMLVLYARLVPCEERLVAYRTHGEQQVGVPTKFLPSVRQRGVKAVFARLGREAQTESQKLVPQLESLLVRLEAGRGAEQLTSALPRLQRALAFHRMRSHVQQQRLLARLKAVLIMWQSYEAFSMKPGKNRLIDLVAAYR